MKTKNSYLMLRALAMMMSACSKENARVEPQPVLYQVEAHTCTNEQDESVMHLARAIGKAVRSNGELRTLIHDKAIEQFDGDYDVLLSRVKKTPVRISDPGLLTKGGQDVVSFDELIASYYDEGIRTKSETGSILDELVAAYPELQVSVPVHAEEWDPETYTPAVVFVTTEMDPDDLEVLPGYDAEGNAIEMDAKIAPEKPVIVVGYNERIIKDTLSFEPEFTEVPLPPVLDDVYQTNQSVILNWSLQELVMVKGYDVWKKGPGDTAFSKVASINKRSQTTYEDTDVLAGYTYQYYVRTYVLSEGLPLYSLASNIKTYTVTGHVPEVNTFSVNPSGTNVELCWKNGGATGSHVCIDYLYPGWTAYQNLATFGENDTEYIFTPTTRGQKVTFKAYRKGNLGQSDPVYDYIYPPYRDASQDSEVYITGVSCTKNPDSWFNGRPDFYVKIIEQSFSGDTLFVQKHVDLPVTSGLSATYTNKLGHKWSIRENVEKGWYSTLVFGLYESDYSVRVKSAKVEAELVKKEKLNLVPSIKASVEFSIGKWDEDCGSTYIRYFNNPKATLVFPNYGAKLTIE